MKERTLILIKPDGVCKDLIGEIIKRIENKSFKIVALKMIKPEQKKIEEFYEPHKGKLFFPGLIEFMQTAPCTAMIVEGEGVVKSIRELIGNRIPMEAVRGSIRGDFGSDGRRNIIHGSDSLESAKREIDCFFSSQEVFSYDQADWLNSESG